MRDFSPQNFFVEENLAEIYPCRRMFRRKKFFPSQNSRFGIFYNLLYFRLRCSERRTGPPPSSSLGPPEIDFFAVSDDFEQKEKFSFGVKIFLDLKN